MVPMMKLTLPTNSQKISKKVTEIATLKFVNTNKLDLSLYNLSDEDKYLLTRTLPKQGTSQASSY